MLFHFNNRQSYLSLLCYVLQELCKNAAVTIEATSARIEQAVCNMLEVFQVNYEKVKQGSKPRKRPTFPNEDSPEEVKSNLIYKEPIFCYKILVFHCLYNVTYHFLQRFLLRNLAVNFQ